MSFTTRRTVVVKTVPFAIRITTTGGGNVQITRIEQIPPNALSRVIALQVWHGLVAGIVDLDQGEMYLADIDIDNAPDVTGIRSSALWASVFNWNFLTGGHMVQTIEHEFVPILSPGVDNTPLADRQRERVWAFWLRSVGGAWDHASFGTLTVEHIYIDKVHGDDAYTWNGDPDDVNRDGVSGIDMGWY